MAKHLSIAGISVSLSIESESRRATVARRNSHHEVLMAAVEDPRTAQIAMGRGQFVAATPLCTPLSKAGGGQGFRSDSGRAMLDAIVFARRIRAVGIVIADVHEFQKLTMVSVSFS